MIVAEKQEVQELDTFLPLKEAAEYVDISPSSIRMVILRGNLYGVKIRGVWHVTLRDLYNYIESRPTRMSRIRRDWAKVRPLPPQPVEINDRDWSIFTRYVTTTEPLTQIGKYHDLTAQRVQAICERVSEHLFREIEEQERGR